MTEKRFYDNDEIFYWAIMFSLVAMIFSLVAMMWITVLLAWGV